MKIFKMLGKFFSGTSPKREAKMKGEIDDLGDLWTDKGGRGLTLQRCTHKHFDRRGKTDRCNHNCPLFGEPEIGYTEPTNPEFGPAGMRRITVLEICHGKVLEFSKLDDQRGKE